MFLRYIVAAFSISILTQVIGLIRQIAIAAYFGATRKMDVYFMTYTIANLLIFIFAIIFDTVGIPHLVKCREEKGEEEFKKFTGSIFTFSIIFSALLTLLFILIMPIVVNLIATGFSADDKSKVAHMAYYFIPWISVFLPYLALCSFYKSIRSFNLVFAGEFVISLSSLAFIFFVHSDTHFIPIAYFAGYFVAFLILFSISFRHFKRIGHIFSSEMKSFYKNFAELFGANQISSVYLFTERFIQSFLPAGGVSILSYAFQITTNISGLLTFRDIFIVPLSSKTGRSEKLERVVIGLSVIAAPVMVFLCFFSKDIVSFLFLRGKFDAEAAGFLSKALSVYALTILPGIAGVPAFRMFQVIDRIKNTGFIYLFNIVMLLSFGSIFIFLFKMGIMGFAYAILINSYLSSAFTFFLLYKNKIVINYKRVAKFIFYALGTSLLAGYLCSKPTIFSNNNNLALVVKSLIYLLLTGLAFLPLKRRLMAVAGYSIG